MTDAHLSMERKTEVAPRHELVGKQTPGTWSVDIDPTSEEWSEDGVKGYDVVSDCGREVVSHEGIYADGEADAALIAEAGTVANRTGMWPLDMEMRILELESRVRNLESMAETKSNL